MATGVLFGNPRSLILQPGAYTQIDASALQFAAPFAFNTVCILGAAIGGEPMRPLLFNDSVQAQQVFGAGTPLAEAISLAFQGGANGGAPAVIGVRVDNSDQATGTLLDANTGTGLFAKFKDFGAYGNTFSVSFMSGSAIGIKSVIEGKYLDGRAFRQTFDNESSFSRLIDRINKESPIALELTSGGTRASQTIQISTSQIDGRATLTDCQGQQRSNQAYCYQYPALMSENATDSMVVTYNGQITATVSALDAATDTFTTSAAHNLVPGNYVQISGGTLPPEINPANNYLVYAVPAATTLQIAAIASPTEWAISAFTDVSDTFTAPGNTLANGDVVQLDGTQLPIGAVRGRNYFVVNESGDNFQIAVTASGTPVAMSGTINGLLVRRIAGGVLNVTGTATGAKITLLPGLATVSNSNPTDFNGARQSAKTVAAYTLTLTNAIASATAYSSDSARITLQGSDTWGHLLGRSLPGTIFDIPSGIYQGTYQIQWQEWDGLAADKVRVVRKLTGDRRIAEGIFSAAFNFWHSFQFPKIQPARNAVESRLPANGLLATGGQYLSVVVGDVAVNLSTTIGDTIQQVGDRLAGLINQTKEIVVTSAAAYNPTTFTSTITLVAEVPGTIANDYTVQGLVNQQTTLLIAANGTKLQGGIDPSPPRNTQGIVSGFIRLANGFDSVPTYQRWLDGLNAVKYLSLRWLVPAGTDDLGVQTAFADHCKLMSASANRRERMTVLGHGLGWTSQQIRDRAELFQNERVVFVSSGLRLTDGLTGLSKMYPASAIAALIAGVFASEGNGISDPITHTYLRNVQQAEINYQPGSIELDDMIRSGVLAIERDPSITRVNRGFRIARAITTWRVDAQVSLTANIFESVSVLNQSDFIAASVREMEEALFIGAGILSDTLEMVRTEVNLELLKRSQQKIIFGYDPAFTQASLNADNPRAIDVVYKIFPIPDLDFILNTQILAPIPVEV